MSKKIRLKDKQGQRQECGSRAPHGIRHEKNSEAQADWEDGRGHPCSPQQSVRVVAIEKVASGSIFHHFKISVGNGRRSERQPQERDRGDELDKRGMFGIGSEIEILPVPVAGEDMDAFVKGLGLLPRGQREFRSHDGKQQSDSDYESDATRRNWILIGHVSESD